MKYKINECTIGGVINPTLTLIGWVENSADKVVIKYGNHIVDEKIINKVRTRVTTFHYEISLIKGQNEYEIYFANNQEEIFVQKVKTNRLARIVHKYKVQHAYKKSINNQLTKEIKDYYKNTINYKNSKEYTDWLKKHESFEPLIDYKYQPKISLVIPVYNVPGEYLGYCLDSILNQTYQNFEICIADDCSTNKDTIETLHKYMKKDDRIKVFFRKENGHISRATNSALELVSGEFIGLMDNDDKLEMHALNEIVHVLNRNPSIDFIYTDEDKIDMEGNRSDPHFKSDFAIDSLYGGNYICHFSVIRKTLIDKIGGFRVGYEGAQDFDLFLRLTNETKNIYHIPKVLYHWRMIPGSTAVGGDGAKNYAADAGKRALIDYFDRKGIKVNIDNFISTNYFVEYLFDNEPTVEIIIYNYDNQSEIIDSIKNKTLYKNYHITFVNKDMSINEINTIIDKIQSDYFIFIEANCLINTVDWIDLMIGYVSQQHIGVVGCKILDKDMIVRESGYYLSDDYTKIYTNGPILNVDYGYNGRLLIPYDYTLVENCVFAISKKRFINLDGNYDLSNAFYDLQLKLLDNGFNNVLLPQVEITSLKIKNSSVSKEVLNNYKNCIERTNYYNKNFMLEKAYCIEKIGGKS